MVEKKEIIKRVVLFNHILLFVYHVFLATPQNIVVFLSGTWSQLVCHFYLSRYNRLSVVTGKHTHLGLFIIL